MSEITVRRVTRIDEMHQLEAIQREIWARDEHMIIHTHWMVALARNGGLVLGAFDDDRAIGLLIGFLGTDQPPGARPAMADLKHVSKRMGVLPAYQNAGVGFLLKVAQRDFVRRQGVRLVTWTFDPLRSRNAYLNMHKLGAVTRRYLRDYYGELHDLQNDGVPSDRLAVEWWVTSKRVEQRLTGARGRLTLDGFLSANVPILNPTAPGAGGFAYPGEIADAGDSAIVLVEIPTNFADMLARDRGLAQAWREHGRAVFEPVFADGYIATDFLHEEVEGRRRSFYVLIQGDAG